MNETVTVPLNEYLKIKAVYDNPRMNDEFDKYEINRLTNEVKRITELNNTYEESKESRREVSFLRESAIKEEHKNVVKDLAESLAQRNRRVIDLIGENEKLKEQVKTLENDNKSKMAEIDALEDTNEELSNENSDLQDELVKMDNMVNALRNEVEAQRKLKEHYKQEEEKKENTIQYLVEVNDERHKEIKLYLSQISFLAKASIFRFLSWKKEYNAPK